jgi:hypothetical protein
MATELEEADALFGNTDLSRITEQAELAMEASIPPWYLHWILRVEPILPAVPTTGPSFPSPVRPM